LGYQPLAVVGAAIMQVTALLVLAAAVLVVF
jgi:hypothetical protein